MRGMLRYLVWIFIFFVLGVADLRLGKNAMIDNYYGQGGGSVLPTERGKGLGKLFIKLCMAKAKEKGFESVILTCEERNIASREAIKFNGGKYIGNSSLNGKVYERYLLSLVDN